MRLEIAERLRCPNAHAPTPLVVVAERVIERELVEGRAGCPVCRAEARLVEGDLWFTTSIPSNGAPEPRPVPFDPSALDRLVALLGLAEPDGTVLLAGAYARFAALLATQAEVGVVTLASSGEGPLAGYRRGLPVASVHGLLRSLPFSDGTFRAAALDTRLPSALVDDMVRTVAVGGRLVGALGVALPDGVRELARDAIEWVGEREVAAPLVTIGRRADP